MSSLDDFEIPQYVAPVFTKPTPFDPSEWMEQYINIHTGDSEEIIENTKKYAQKVVEEYNNTLKSCKCILKKDIERELIRSIHRSISKTKGEGHALTDFMDEVKSKGYRIDYEAVHKLDKEDKSVCENSKTNYEYIIIYL